MARKPQDISITAIAEEAGVSVATVSRVMNRRTGVSEEMRRRIDRLLRGRGFKPNYPAPRSPSIAALLPLTEFSSYISAALTGIYSHTSKNGVNVNIIMKDAGSRESVLERIRELQCSGVIVILPSRLEENYLSLCRSELPVVFVDSAVDISGIGYVDNDSYSGAKEAAERLLKLGHRKIAFFQWEKWTRNQTQRLNAYRDALRSAGVEPRPEWVIQGKTLSAPEDTVGAGLVRRMLETAPDVTAVMAVDDSLAIEAMGELHRRGVRIPDDISITGFDNIRESLSCWPALTTVDHPIGKAAALAAESISAALESPGRWTPPALVLPTRLIVRGSDGPAAKKS